ncbi:recombinase, partial [Escherichia coli]|nr:recombinase [Escherichia coli]
KKKNIGKDRTIAVAIAREYNLRMRPELYPSVDNLIRESGGVTGEAKPFAEHVDHIMARIVEDERPSQSTLDDWKNDALRVKDFFLNI